MEPDGIEPDGVDRWTLTTHRFRQIAIVTTVGLCLLVVAGGVVRLTGSGLGCDDWPNCNEERFVDVSTGHAAIEQVNRLLSGVIGIPTLAMAIGAFRVRPRRPWRGPSGLVIPSIGVLATVLANGVVGGMAVRADLHPALVQSHFLLAMGSIAFGLVAIRRSGPAFDRALGGESVSRPTSRLLVLSRVVGIMTALAIATGTVVTGTGPHAGDVDVRRWGFDISTVSRIHSLTVIAVVAVALIFATQLRREPRSVASALRPTFSTWMFLAIVQGGIGYVQYFTGVPEVLVAAHIAGATSLWVATVWLVTGVSSLTRVSGRGARAQDGHPAISDPVTQGM